MYNPISKKVIVIFGCVVIILNVIFLAIGSPSYIQRNITGTEADNIVKEYDEKEQIELFGENEAYAMGLNAEDNPVFKDKWKALSQIKEDCPNGLKLIKKTHHLGLNLSIFYWEWYQTYSTYQHEQADESVQQELTKIQHFFEVYQNSFYDETNPVSGYGG